MSTDHEWHPAIAERCAGCGKKEPQREPGQLPKGWIIVSNPLYGQRWEATACSHRCASDARMRTISLLKDTYRVYVERGVPHPIH